MDCPNCNRPMTTLDSIALLKDDLALSLAVKYCEECRWVAMWDFEPIDNPLERLRICPGCGWYTDEHVKGDCLKCNYEIGTEPYRMLSVSEMMERGDMEYNDVRLDLFLETLFGVLK